MKYSFFVLLLLLFSCKKDEQSANYKHVKHIPSIVDSLNTNAQVKEYLATKVDTNLRGFDMPPLDQMDITPFGGKNDSIFRSSFKKHGVTRNFYKADFDNNGYTDMLLLGGYGNSYYSFVVMNNGNSDPKVHLMGSFDYLFIPKLIYRKGNPLLEIHGEKPDFSKKKISFKPFHDILHWKNIGFAGENQNPKEYKIEKIQFVERGCYGTCPVFEIHIDDKGKAFFFAEFYNFSHNHGAKPEDKVFVTTLSNKTYNEIKSFLNYIDFPTLHNNYSVFYTDAASCDLIITYDGGKTKKISDYGMLGSHELIALYTYFKDLRFNQKWKETQEPKGMRINTWMKDME